MPFSSRRGLTLVETLIAAAVAALALTAVLRMLVPVMHVMGKGSARSQMAQQATVAFARMGEDLDLATPQACVAETDATTGDVCLGVQAMEDVDAAGNRVWSPHLVLYAWSPSTGRLTRREWSSGEPLSVQVTFRGEAPAGWTPELVHALATTTPTMTIASGITQAQITEPTPNTIAVSLAFSLAAANGTTEKESLSIGRTFYLCNH